MELLLWRWSTMTQIVAALILAVFFAVLNRSVRRVELRPWVLAWLVNLAALAITVIYWFIPPQSPAIFLLIRVGYMFSKTLFVVLLVSGASGFAGAVTIRWRTAILAWVGAFAVGGALLFNELNAMGAAQAGVICVVFAMGAYSLFAYSNVPAAGWLASGFVARAALGAAEMAAYWSQTTPGPWSSSPAIGLFLSSCSSFDAAAEWVIALGCVLMLYRTIQGELTQSNTDLLAAQSVLQQLADRDPMTGLANRRALPGVFREVFSTGATLLFFDLDNFKEVNDSYGHSAGDACLRRFAHALQASFRPDDYVVRHGGDEFLVIATGVGPPSIDDRLETLRRRIESERGNGPEVRFSVGRAHLAAGGDPEDAIRLADAAMYQEKIAGRASRAQSA